MSRTFKHLTYEQRVKIKEMLDGGYAKTEIARALDIHNATIYREIERGSVNGQYDPDYSENLYKQQLPKKGPKPILAVDSELSKYIAKLILSVKTAPPAGYPAGAPLCSGTGPCGKGAGRKHSSRP